MKPKIFTHTIYRLPTLEELIDVNTSKLSAEEIIDGFRYTIIGRGIKGDKEKKLIHQSIQMLHKIFPQNPEYKKAFEMISQEYGLNESLGNRLIRIINEEISAIRKDKDEEIFDYHSITEDAWSDPKHDAQDFQKIHFDFENDDSTGQKKRFFMKKNLRKDQPIKYEINAELFRAGGDWEISVLYFRLEFTHDYGIVRFGEGRKVEYVWDLEKKKAGGLSHSYVIIPPNEAGNKLQKGSDDDKSEWYAYSDNDTSKEKRKELEITDADQSKAWEWLQKLLEKVINERHEMLDDDSKSKVSEPKDSAE